MGQCPAMYARWSASLKAPLNDSTKLRTEATALTGSRCVTTKRASGYVSWSSLMKRGLREPKCEDGGASATDDPHVREGTGRLHPAVDWRRLIQGRSKLCFVDESQIQGCWTLECAQTWVLSGVASEE